MLIPLRHENMEGRRWPVITFALIALNVLVFLGTHWKMEAETPERAEVRTHLILLAALHPELKMSNDVQQFITDVQRKVPEAFWKKIADPNRKIEDAWDARIRSVTDPEELQAEMDLLAQRFGEEEKSSILDNYGFVPAHPRPITYLTSMFLHTGWLHLIGNMWFLWLTGFVLEDRWGRIIYPTFYIVARRRGLNHSCLVQSGEYSACPRRFRWGRSPHGWLSSPIPEAENPNALVHADFPYSL